MATPGTWFGLPDFGITEALTGSWGNPKQTLFNNPSVSTVGSNFPQGSYFGNPAPAPTGPQKPVQKLPAPPTGGGGAGGSTNLFNGQASGGAGPAQQTQQQPSGPDMSALNAGYDAYTQQLNDMLNTGLPGQRAGQEQITNASYNQGVNQLGTQRTQSQQSVEQSKAANLKDLAGNVKNLFTAGNINLGARGAGDSSAANQYSYAVTKMGTKARGDINTQATDRLNQINDIFNSEISRLETEKNTRMGQIADWFNGAQNQIRQQIGATGLARGKDVQQLAQQAYNVALQAMQQLQTEQANRRSTLETWAMNNAKDVQTLVANMQQASQLPAFGGIQSGMPQQDQMQSGVIPVGYGTNDGQKRDIFRNVTG